MNVKKPSSKQPWIDPDDAPELDEAFLAEADLFHGEKLIRRGRPLAAVTKAPITIRFNPVTVDRFKATGKGWQTRMDAALTDWLKDHSPEEIRI